MANWGGTSEWGTSWIGIGEADGRGGGTESSLENSEGSEFLRKRGRGERMSRSAIAEWRVGLLVYGVRCFWVLGPATGCGLVRVLGRGRAGEAGTVNALVGVDRELEEDGAMAASSAWSDLNMALKTDL